MSDTTEAMRAALLPHLETFRSAAKLRDSQGQATLHGSYLELVVAALEHPTPAAPTVTDITHTGAVPAWDEDDLYAIERAADLLEEYVDFIRADVTSADIERHPYLPEVETTAEALRALAAQPSPERNDCERCGKRLGSTLGVHTCTPPGESVWEQCAKIAEDDDHVVRGRGYHDQLDDADATVRNIAAAIRAAACTPPEGGA